MALNDILDSIIADADKRIAEASAAHKARMKDMREQNERALNRKRVQIAEQRDQKKRQLKEKAESHARMVRSKAILSRKQELMNALYADVLDELAKLPKDKAEAFVKTCLSHIRGKGTILPSKAHEALLKKLAPEGCEIGNALDSVGGFRFVSDREEHDFTFEFLVNGLLRPQTEVSVAQEIFPARS